MLEKENININLITRVVLLIFTILLFLVLCFIFSSSYRQYEEIQKRTQSLLVIANESQKKIDFVYRKYTEIEKSFRSAYANSKNYELYQIQLHQFDNSIDSLLESRKSFIKDQKINYIDTNLYNELINDYVRIKHVIKSAIELSNQLNVPKKRSTAVQYYKKNELLAQNIQVLENLISSIRNLNDTRLKIRKDTVDVKINELIQQSQNFRNQTFISLSFILILIFTIIYYQLFTSYFIRKLQYEKVYARKLVDAKSMILTEITHEIRTPMNSLVGILEILKKKNYTYDEEDTTLIESAYSNILDTTKTINDILNVNTYHTTINRFTNLDIEKLTREIIEVQNIKAKIKGIELTFIIAPNSPTIIYNDETKLRNIIAKLISNAIKYSQGGKVKCELIISEKSILIIKVSDNGIGIPDDLKQIIFKKFIKTESNNKYSNGIGLGLFITKKTVESLNGKIDYNSTLNEGTAFTVEIPIYKAKHRLEKAIEYTEITDFNPSTSWLIVDDNALNLLYLKSFLAKYEKLFTAINGIEALEIINKEKIDVIITDINMPKMSGDELLMKIREKKEYDNIKIIATSSDNEQVKKLEIENNCYFDNILTKPFTEKDLIKAVANTLNVA